MEPESRDPSCAGRYRCPKKTKNWGKGYPQPEKYEFYPYGALYGAAPDTPKNQPPNNQPRKDLLQNLAAAMKNDILIKNAAMKDKSSIQNELANETTRNSRPVIAEEVRKVPAGPRRILKHFDDLIGGMFDFYQPPNKRYPTREENMEFLRSEIKNRFQLSDEPNITKTLQEIINDLDKRINNGVEQPVVGLWDSFFMGTKPAPPKPIPPVAPRVIPVQQTAPPQPVSLPNQPKSKGSSNGSPPHGNNPTVPREPPTPSRSRKGSPEIVPVYQPDQSAVRSQLASNGPTFSRWREEIESPDIPEPGLSMLRPLKKSPKTRTSPHADIPTVLRDPEIVPASDQPIPYFLPRRMEPGTKEPGRKQSAMRPTLGERTGRLSELLLPEAPGTPVPFLPATQRKIKKKVKRASKR